MEITIDPYKKSLQENYYYPLTTEMTTAEMQIKTNEVPEGTPLLSPALGGTSTVFLNKKKNTTEDSVDVLSELIAEIQATDDKKIPNNESNPAPNSPHPTQSPRQLHNKIHFSLAQQKRVSNSSKNHLLLLKKFFHVLLSTKVVSILPVRCDSTASPMKSTSVVNELHATSVKVFFKASWHAMNFSHSHSHSSKLEIEKPSNYNHNFSAKLSTLILKI